MDHSRHHTTNQVFGAPLDWDEANPNLPCDALPVTQHYIQDGVKSHPAITSYWKPTAEELAALNAGQFVTVTFLGVLVPPMAIGVEP